MLRRSARVAEQSRRRRGGPGTNTSEMFRLRLPDVTKDDPPPAIYTGAAKERDLDSDPSWRRH
jgi:hypothetical protein